MRSAALFIWLVCLVADSALQAQAPTMQAVCARCQIHVREYVRFQSIWSDGALTGVPLALAMLASDEWVIIDASMRDAFRFDAAGRFRGSLGRRGSGPGEFSEPSFAFRTLADTTFVLDGALARLSVFDARGRLVDDRRWSGGGPTQVMTSVEGGFVVPGRYPTRSSFGHPLHRFSQAGELRASFGSPRGETVRREDDTPILRVPARSDPDGGFWTVNARQPALQRWDRQGRLAESWLLPIRNFRPLSRTSTGERIGAEFFVIERAAPDLLWLSVSYVSAEHRQALGPVKVIDGRETRQVMNYGRYFRTLVMVVKPDTKEVLAVEEIPLWLVGSLGAGKFWGLSPEGLAGTPTVVSLVFTQP